MSVLRLKATAMKTRPETSPSPQKNTDFLQKPGNTSKDSPGRPCEADYVDLDFLKTAKLSLIGDGDQQNVSTNKSGISPPRLTDGGPNNNETAPNPSGNKTTTGEDKTVRSLEPSALVNISEGPLSPKESQTPSTPSLSKKLDSTNPPNDEEPRYTYMSEDYDDDDVDDNHVSLVISDNCVPCATQDESHYITTHEIQLTELSDHEGGRESGQSSSVWEIEDDNRVYTFVDYACFDGDGATEAGKGERGSRYNTGAAVSTLQESDPCDPAKSSDESLPQIQNTTGQIHLSIKTTSRAINDQCNIQEKENILCHAGRSGDTSRYVLRGADGKADTFRDRAKCFIAVPGRVHVGTKTKGKTFNGHSSSTSSAFSELDDADKEVRNLTARTFKSLAYPYFDLSTSSESLASECGLGINRWSTFVDLKYGRVGLDKSRASHKNSASSSIEIAKGVDNKGCKSMALASIKAPPSKIITLNKNPNSTSSSTKRFELMGKFSQGVITLRETLNFSCNLQPRVTEGERERLKLAQNAAGSRSTDEVTRTLPSSQRRAVSQIPCNAGDAMDGTHKKAVFASSLIKNVISKKMQFEQERKMERGEIFEPRRAPSQCFAHRDSDPRKERPPRENVELQRQDSFSEASSDMTIVCLDELGDIVDSGSCDTKSDSRRRDTLTHARESNLESTNEPGINTKKEEFQACNSTLLRSQNSAFRSWRDRDLKFQKEHKNDTTPERNAAVSEDNPAQGDLYFDSGNSTLTKMSHLFVPSIQLLSNDGEMNSCVRAPADQGVGEVAESGTNNTLYVPDCRGVMTTKSKSPEIKINLRRVKDNKQEQCGDSALRPTDLGCKAASLIRTDDSRCHALSAALKGEYSDKVPQFMVRDIRDNKGKLQTPIHQVRDVRKLVKSSYHFVSLDNNDNKCCYATSDPYLEQKKQVSNQNPLSVSPIVITCQSVNTNGNGKQSENAIDTSKRGLDDDPFEIDRSSPEGAKGDSALLQRRWAIATSNKDSHKEGMRLGAEATTASRWQERIADGTEKTDESSVANQGPLEKLKAAVKTMERLYVFDRNEWKRKSESLSLISRKEQEDPDEEEVAVAGRWSNALPTSSMDKPLGRDSYPITAPAVTATSVSRRNDKGTPDGREGRLGAKPLPRSSPMGTRNAFAHMKTIQPSTHAHHAPSNAFAPRSTKAPETLRSAHTQPEQQQQQRPAFTESHGVEAESSENYLAFSERCRASSSHSNRQATQAEQTSYTSPAARARSPPGSPQQTPSAGGPRGRESSPSSKCNVVTETRSPETPATATVYHSMPQAVSAPQPPQMYCFSPAVTPGPALEHFQPTQRKMLLDPSTGSYYLVDTPVQPATRRLFDPETGQYVDVPMPPTPVTPLPMQMPVPISPLALSPAAYGHSYVIYPGFMATSPVVPTRTLNQSQLPDVESGEKVSAQRAEGFYMESPFYMATGKGLSMAQAGYVGGQHHVLTGRAPQQGAAGNRPVISITSQQGPRIIAPPTFDGTTMSFVVEHR